MSLACRSMVSTCVLQSEHPSTFFYKNKEKEILTLRMHSVSKQLLTSLFSLKTPDFGRADLPLLLFGREERGRGSCGPTSSSTSSLLSACTSGERMRGGDMRRASDARRARREIPPRSVAPDLNPESSSSLDFEEEDDVTTAARRGRREGGRHLEIGRAHV